MIILIGVQNPVSNNTQDGWVEEVFFVISGKIVIQFHQTSFLS